MMKFHFTRPIATALTILLCPILLWSQLTLRVTSIPANTPPNANIYVAGTFNNWNPGDPASQLHPIGNGRFEITLPLTQAGQIKFKFTRGSWATVEGNASGGFLPDRVFNYTNQPTVLELSILSWEGQGSGSTAAPNVQILHHQFYMPQLNRYRRIWIYLPPDYATSNKHYPVLYLHDGQNLFDAATSFAGEWKVDETLNQLHAAGDRGCIVIGIDNGGQFRIDEYSPWVNLLYGGGQGDLYLQFIVEILKPYVDAHFRTLPHRQATGIGGSSMGGLISQYALIERQDVFSKAAVFSPAFWFAVNNSVNHVLAVGKKAPVRVYFLAGGAEPPYVAQHMRDVADAMLSVGFDPSEMYWTVPADGSHREWFWAREFPAAYVWLFNNQISDTPEHIPQDEPIAVFPNPASHYLRLNHSSSVHYQIICSVTGKILDNSTLTPQQSISIAHLPAGIYFLKIINQNATATLLKFLVVH